MEVGVSELRAHLSDWIDRARAGEEVIVTDRGAPIVRLVGVESTALLEQLTEQGVIARPQTPRRPNAGARPRVRARASVADLVSEQRR
jgi:prevent-host-death family protein